MIDSSNCNHDLLIMVNDQLTSILDVDTGRVINKEELDGAGVVTSNDRQGATFPDTNPKTRIGLTKPSTAAIPPSAIVHLGLAMSNGVVKYGKFNWREHAVTMSVYTDAIDRHLMALKDGEDVASDSGVHHLGHVMACCAIMLDALECGTLNDDRGIPGKASELIQRLTESK